jgi:phosphatidylserine/phosphatidylglycerophosphate/cardiolipin synthase-like enzyme
MRQGPIAEYTGSREVDYGDRDLGRVWVQRSVTPAVARPEPDQAAGRTLIPILPDSNGKFIGTLAAVVRKAKGAVCLSSYMIQQSELTRALLEVSSRDVRVYVLTAGEEELSKIDTEMDDVEKAKLDDYKALLNSLAGQVLVRTAPHFHAKFLLVDPGDNDASGFLMTCNATVDAMSGKNLEAASTLTEAEVRSYFSQFVAGFWRESKHELLRPGELSGAHPAPPGIAFGRVVHPATFEGCTTLKERVTGLIDSAKERVVVTGWSFGAGHMVVASLEKAVARGVSVKVFTRPTSANSEALASLASKGAVICGHDRYHAKMVIADGRQSMLMTSNFTERGMDGGFEAGVELGEEQTRALAALAGYWDSFCGWELRQAAKLRDATPLVRREAPTTKKMDVVEVQEQSTNDMGSHNMASLEEPEYNPKVELASPNGPGATRLSKKVRYTWRVIPPTLPPQAAPVNEKEAPFPVYRVPKGGTFIVVTNWEDVEGAKAFASKLKAKMVGPRNHLTAT